MSIINMMLDKIANFYKSNKYVILWTLGYFIVTWAIMNYMFDFNIFSRLRWWQLMHAHLRGFAGFVFGILILAAVPMYIATTIVIARTKAPLFNFKIPEFIKNAFQQTPMEEDVCPTPSQDDTKIQTVESIPEKEPDPIPDTVPTELLVAYKNAREHISRTPSSVFDLGNVTNATKVSPKDLTEHDDAPVQEIPIPTDFDIDDLDTIVDNDIPHFTDINFDDDEEETELNNDIQELSETTIDVAKHMSSQSIPYTVIGDVIVSDKYAIVSHTDPDFWVADETAWFAAGKTRKSPIELVKRVASENNVQPILYLGANNIMDIETLIPQWENDGIRIITDLKDLK